MLKDPGNHILCLLPQALCIELLTQLGLASQFFWLLRSRGLEGEKPAILPGKPPVQPALTDTCPVPVPDLGSWVNQTPPALWILAMMRGDGGSRQGAEKNPHPQTSHFSDWEIQAKPPNFLQVPTSGWRQASNKAGSVGTDHLIFPSRDMEPPSRARALPGRGPHVV